MTQRLRKGASGMIEIEKRRRLSIDVILNVAVFFPNDDDDETQHDRVRDSDCRVNESGNVVLLDEYSRTHGALHDIVQADRDERNGDGNRRRFQEYHRSGGLSATQLAGLQWPLS